MGNFNKQKYDNEFAKANYDRCIFNVPKGQKAIIEAHWKAMGYKSLNAYVNKLIARDMEKNSDNSRGGYKLILYRRIFRQLLLQ